MYRFTHANAADIEQQDCGIVGVGSRLGHVEAIMEEDVGLVVAAPRTRHSTTYFMAASETLMTDKVLQPLDQ